MIPIPNDFDNARAYDGNSFPTLPLGAHVCRVLRANVVKTRANADMLVIDFDVYEGGAFDEYYKKRYDANRQRNANAKWPGVFRANLLTRDGATSGYFKGFITALEESNPGYNFRASGGNEAAMRGMYVGLVFGEEEFKTNDTHEIKTTVKPFYAVSVPKAREGVPIPARKTLPQVAASAGFSPVESDPDLPF